MLDIHTCILTQNAQSSALGKYCLPHFLRHCLSHWIYLIIITLKEQLIHFPQKKSLNICLS